MQLTMMQSLVRKTLMKMIAFVMPLAMCCLTHEALLDWQSHSPSFQSFPASVTDSLSFRESSSHLRVCRLFLCSSCPLSVCLFIMPGCSHAACPGCSSSSSDKYMYHDWEPITAPAHHGQHHHHDHAWGRTRPRARGEGLPLLHLAEHIGLCSAAWREERHRPEAAGKRREGKKRNKRIWKHGQCEDDEASQDIIACMESSLDWTMTARHVRDRQCWFLLHAIETLIIELNSDTMITKNLLRQ